VKIRAGNSPLIPVRKIEPETLNAEVTIEVAET
jgi:hypothetical protein